VRPAVVALRCGSRTQAALAPVVAFG